MTTKVRQQPSTPLPYITNKRDEIVAIPDFRKVANCVHATNGPDDAAYLVFTANAYPKLIEALRTAMHQVVKAEDCRAIQNLLVEMGEAQ